MDRRAARNRPHHCGRCVCPTAAHLFVCAPTPPRPHWQLSGRLIMLPVPVPPPQVTALPSTVAWPQMSSQIGRASCRERVFNWV